VQAPNIADFLNSAIDDATMSEMLKEIEHRPSEARIDGVDLTQYDINYIRSLGYIR
jgi:hypothetical protein